MTRLDGNIFPDERHEMKDPILKVQSILYRILCYFDLICRNHQLNYFLDAGTLLGAKRHNGFIPWDDDIDIIMPRGDYERFIAIAQRELPEDIFLDLIYIKNYPGDYYVPCKIRDRHTRINSVTYGHEAEIGQGISIDIFPLDRYSKSKTIFFCQHWLKKIFRKLCRIKQRKNDYNILYIKLINYLVYLYLFIFGSAYFRKPDTLFSNVDIIGLGYDTYFERYYEYDDIFPLREALFSKNKFFIPAKTEKILEIMYGIKYMTLPPIENRVTHIKSLIFDTRKNIEVCYL